MEVDEIYWEMVSFVLDTAEIFITGYYVHRFFEPFLTKKRLSNYAGLTYIIVSFILYSISFEMSGALVSAVSLSVVFVVVYLIDTRNLEQKIFLSLLCYLLEWIAWGMVVAGWNITYDLSMLIPAMQSSVVLQFAAYIIRCVIWIIEEILLMGVFVKLIHRIYIDKTENLTKREFVLMMAPLLSFAFGRLVFRYFVNVYEMDLKQYVWENHHSYDGLLFFYQFISFAATLTVIAMYQRIKDAQRREKEETVLAKQIEDIERHIGEVEKLYQDIRSLKHDMRNHVMVLENLYGKNAEANLYTARLKAQIDDMRPGMDIQSGNPVTDIIIREKQKEAEEKNIAFTYEFHYPKSSALNAFDVSVILSNALNNAIEAADECKNPYIKLLSYNKNNAYMIEVVNSIAKQRIIDEESGMPVTTKKSDGHGFGLNNIRKMSQKYCGDIDIEQSENEFTLSVMLLID